MKLIKTFILWILALQLLNMSICSEAYWSYFNDSQFSNHSDKAADPTETIVEWLVELKMGQQDAFTYDHNNIDSKNTVKAVVFPVDMENHSTYVQLIKKSRKVLYAYFPSKVESTSLEILSPPPDGDIALHCNTI